MALESDSMDSFENNSYRCRRFQVRAVRKNGRDFKREPSRFQSFFPAVRLRESCAAAFLFCLVATPLVAQERIEDFGYRRICLDHRGVSVELVVKSKDGEAKKKKPLLILIRGSLAKPLVKFNKNGGHYPPFPFDQNIFLENYHLICIGKPGIPLIANKDDLNARGEFIDPVTGGPPEQYVENNFLDFYVERNSKVVEFLLSQKWVDSTKIVVAGHSQGSDIAANMADKISGITHLIYSSGSPYFSTVIDMVRKARELEGDERAEEYFKFWEDVVKTPFAPPQRKGWDSNKTVFSFSQCQNEVLKRARIPTLVTYGAEDTLAPFNDLFRIETIRDRITNMTFKAYSGVEHNYFGVDNDGKIDFQKFGWDVVARDWLQWLNQEKLQPMHPIR